MRTSLSRSVVAMAALGVASATFAAPAMAAVPAGVTRDQIVTIVAGVRADYAAAGSTGLTQESYDRLNVLANQVCDHNSGTDEATDTFVAIPTNVGSADGIVVSTDVIRGEGDLEGYETCTFGALATGSASSLVGSYNLQVKDESFDTPVVTTWAGATSGNVFVTPMTYTFSSDVFSTSAVLTAGGSATRPITVPTSTRVVTPKTAQQVKAAQKAYDKSAASAKKAYKKALKKAGKSTSKKKAAKKTYNARIAKARAAYGVAAGSTSKIVTGSRNDTERLPYSLGAQIVVPS